MNLPLPQLETRYCPLCGPGVEKKLKYPPSFKDGHLNPEIFSARRQPDRHHFRLMQCVKCEMIYSDPACDPEQLDQLYRQSKVTYGDLEEQIYQSYAPVLDRAIRATPNRKTFVEIGGGRGFMLRYGAENGFAEQIEIEPSSDAQRRFVPASANSKFITGTFKKGILPSNSVSLICFFQILDHAPRPKEFLSEVLQVLEPGGIAVCVTHNTKALPVQLMGEKSPIYDIEHTYLFNPENMRGLFKAAGFEGTETFEVANKYALGYWFDMTPLPSSLKAGIRPILNHLRISDIQLKLNAGNFGIIARKPKA